MPRGAPGELSNFSDEWPAPNQDLGNQRVATSKIDSSNVDQLGVAWRIPIKGGGTFGNYASTPIVADGVVYTQDLTSNVKAIDLQTGQVKWSKDYNAPDVGPNGVAIGYGKIYGATSDFAFALDKDTGAEVALNVSDGSVKWQRDLAQPAYGAATISNDLVFTTTFEGKVIALDRDTGSVVWEKQMPAGTNAAVAIVGDTLITAASFPQSKGQQPVIIAYRLGATGSATTTTAATTTVASAATGKQVFISNCGSCHTLGAAGTSGAVGPNLDQLKPNAATVQQKVQNGGGGMPSFSARLSSAQIAAVAKYVAENAGKVSPGGGGGGP